MTSAPSMNPDRQLSRSLTKTDYAYESIRERILSGDLPPSEPLDQATLASALDVSTTPLREALRRLESEGLVVSRAHRDTIVAPVDFNALEQVWVVRVELEPLGARLACAKASDAELAAIKTFAENRPTGDDPLTLMRYNGEIHRRIYRSGHNAMLIKVLDSLSDAVDRYRVMTFRTDPGRSQDHRPHAEILAAMMARDADLAARLMREHIEAGLVKMSTGHY